MAARLEQLLRACEIADWTQVALNGGPPCFFLDPEEDERFCLRAERWGGHHAIDADHKFVSFAELIQLLLVIAKG